MKEIAEKKKAAAKQKEDASKVKEEENADVFHVFDGVESDDQMDLLSFPVEDDPFKEFDFTVPSARSTDHQDAETPNSLDTLLDDFISQTEPDEKEPSPIRDEGSQQIIPQSVEQFSEPSPLPEVSSPLQSNEVNDELPPMLPSFEEITERSPENNENPIVDYLDELYNYAVSQTIHF